MTILAEAFVALHAEGAQLPAEIEAQAVAAATSAEATLAEGITAGVVAGAEGAEAGFATIAEEGAAAGIGAGEAIAAGIAEGAAAGGAVAGEELVAAGTAAGTEAGAAAGTAYAETFAKVSTAVGGSTGGLLAAGATGALTAAVAVVAVVKTLDSFVTAARETGGATRALNASLISNAQAAAVPAEAYQAQATALQNLTGFQDEQIVKAEAQEIQFGLTGEQVKKLTPLILDYAARTGKDVPAASSAAVKALLGTGRALKEVGIKFKDAGSLTANYEQLVAGLTRTVGGFAQAQMSGLAGQQRLLAANIQDIKSNLGEVFIPYLTAGAKAANVFLGSVKGADASTQHLSATIGASNPIIGGLHLGFALLSKGADLLTGNTDEAKKALSDAVQTVGEGAQAMRDGKLSVDDFRDSFHEQADAVKAAGGTTEQWHSILNEGHGAIIAYRQELTGLTTQRQVDTQAILENQLAQQALAGGAAGVVAGIVQQRNAQQAVNDAQAKVNRLLEHGKRDTDKYREARTALLGAEAGLVTAHVSLTKNLGDLLIAQNKENATAEEVRDKLEKTGATAGLTKDQVDDLVKSVLHYVQRQGDIKGTIVTEYSAPGLRDALNDAEILATKLDALDARSNFGSTSPSGGGSSGGGGKHHGGGGGGSTGSDAPGTGTGVYGGDTRVTVTLNSRQIQTEMERQVTVLSGG